MRLSVECFIACRIFSISTAKPFKPNDMYTFILLAIAIPYTAMGSCPNINKRAEWGAQPAKSTLKLKINPAPYVVVHHSETPPCTDAGACKNRVKNIQSYHMNTKGWQDIGYNFLIGGDGSIFEGRGWGIHGAHLPSFNQRSIGICLIGSFQNNVPSSIQISALRSLISCGTDLGKIDQNYRLIGHRQGGSTDCPGNKLQEILKTMPHFEPRPVCTCPKIVSRSEWKAKAPTEIIPLTIDPPPYVVVHHSATQNCTNLTSCLKMVKGIQDFHMDTNEWDDIGYQFLIGTEGTIFEGRGWGRKGAHVPKFNARSIGVCLIGNFQIMPPVQIQLDSLKALTDCGVQNGKIAENYTIIGHRQGSATLCPGDYLYEIVQNMSRYNPNPS
ncbi:peptidoglycan recognition protein 3-like [Cylas formicarius]|uniref:peptidoglycan recognition protein 3-like n=1 Tax=Cylas formicarius TaxID=197179 RepID=UPI002958A4B9|nr:peptidoglycan recognition protein 3-like [Cylas formicarius]